MGRTKKEQAERERWWRRGHVPAAILGVDPGRSAGAALSLPEKGVVWARQVQTDTRQLEGAIEDAATGAASAGCERLVLVLEKWGTGGRLGIDQWLGLGAAVGAWERVVTLMVSERPADFGRLITKTRSSVRVQQATWRSSIFESFGSYDGSGKYRPFDSDEWKVEAVKRCSALLPDLEIFEPDAAEAALIAHYGARSDEVAALLRHAWEGA